MPLLLIIFAFPVLLIIVSLLRNKKPVECILGELDKQYWEENNIWETSQN